MPLCASRCSTFAIVAGERLDPRAGLFGNGSIASSDAFLSALIITGLG